MRQFMFQIYDTPSEVNREASPIHFKLVKGNSPLSHLDLQWQYAGIKINKGTSLTSFCLFTFK